MSERSGAPRSGGRAQARTTAGGLGRRVGRDAGTGTGARGQRRSEGADTRRSGIRGREAVETVAPVDGATALDIGTAGEPQPAPSGRPRLWVAPPLPIRAPRATFAAAIVMVIVASVVGILLLSTETMERSFRLAALRDQKAELDKQHSELQRQIVEKSAPGSLHAAARRLGLVPATDPAIIKLPSGEKIGTPKPGEGPASPTAGR
ncbi:hypothetical protein GCM10025331_60220 [Actinoplanes utahensis]|nr:hypothetical protein Aut01nite_75900 [Actinoplanes utahensis]